MNRLAFVFAICGALLWGLAFPIAQQLPGNFPPGVFANTAALSGSSAPAAPTTWNPVDKSADLSVTTGNLIITDVSDGTPAGIRSIASHSTGKFYVELLRGTVASGGGISFGVANAIQALNAFSGSTGSNSVGYFADTSVILNNVTITNIQGGWNNGVITGMAVDLGGKLIWWRTAGGNWNNNASADPATGTLGIDFSAINAGPYFVYHTVKNFGDTTTVNFGASTYGTSAPSLYLNW